MARKKAKLTKRDKKLIERFYRKREEKHKAAKRLQRAAAIKKSKLIKSQFPVYDAKHRRKIAANSAVNTWMNVDAKNYSKIQWRLYEENKDNPSKSIYKRRGKWDESMGPLYVSGAFVARSIAARRYHTMVKFIQGELGGSYANARRAWKAFEKAGVLARLGLDFGS